MKRLYDCYESGDGVEKDVKKAVQFLRMASDNSI